MFRSEIRVDLPKTEENPMPISSHTAKALGAMLRSERFRPEALRVIREALVIYGTVPDAAAELECSSRVLQLWIASSPELADCTGGLPSRGRPRKIKSA